jgi:aspartate-semialdehyde dehydrogenase
MPKERKRARKSKRYSPFLDCGVQVSSRAKLHYFAPMLILILNEVNSFHDVGVVQRGRDAELCGKLLDVLLFRLILAALAEFLKQKWCQVMTMKSTERREERCCITGR